jgi:hypothetical protein
MQSSGQYDNVESTALAKEDRADNSDVPKIQRESIRTRRERLRGMHVNIERTLAVGVSQEPLNGFDIFSIRLQQGDEGVTGRMPVDLLVNAICLRNRPDFTLHEIVRPKGLLCPHGLAGADVIVLRCSGTLTAPAEKIRCHVAVHWHRFGGGFRLAVAQDLMPDRTRYATLQVLKVDIAPAKRQQLVDSKSGSGTKLAQLVRSLQRQTGRTQEECWRFVIKYGIKAEVDHRRWHQEELD